MNRHEQEAIVNAGALQTVCSQLYQKVGVAQSDADTVAEMQVLMDLRVFIRTRHAPYQLCSRHHQRWYKSQSTTSKT